MGKCRHRNGGPGCGFHETDSLICFRTLRIGQACPVCGTGVIFFPPTCRIKKASLEWLCLPDRAYDPQAVAAIEESVVEIVNSVRAQLREPAAANGGSVGMGAAGVTPLGAPDANNTQAAAAP